MAKELPEGGRKGQDAGYAATETRRKPKRPDRGPYRMLCPANDQAVALPRSTSVRRLRAYTSRKIK